jgi:hypothetical protein
LHVFVVGKKEEQGIKEKGPNFLNIFLFPHTKIETIKEYNKRLVQGELSCNII